MQGVADFLQEVTSQKDQKVSALAQFLQSLPVPHLQIACTCQACQHVPSSALHSPVPEALNRAAWQSYLTC